MSDVRVSEIISANYHSVHRAVRNHDYTHFMLDGGRGSLKSSFISLEIPLLMKRNPDVNAIVFRTMIIRANNKEINAKNILSETMRQGNSDGGGDVLMEYIPDNNTYTPEEYAANWREVTE